MKKSYITGIIGGIIGGFICSIPWILVYVKLEMMLSVLSMIIGVGILYGYKFFNGKMDKGFYWILYVTACFIVIMDTLVIIPAYLLTTIDAEITIENLRILINAYKAEFLKDLALGLAFTILGVSGVASLVKNQLNNKEKGIEIPLADIDGKRMDGQLTEIKEYFTSRLATDASNAVSVDIGSNINQQTFNKMLNEGVIVPVGDLYYLDTYRLDNYLNDLQQKRKKSKLITRLCLIVPTVFAITFGAFLLLNTAFGSKVKTVKINETSSFTYNTGFSVIESTEYENDWYIIDDNDPDGETAWIEISYYNDDNYTYDEDEISYYESYISAQENFTLALSEKRVLSDCATCHTLEISYVDGSGYEILNIVYSNGCQYWIDTVGLTKNDCRNIINQSGILENIK